MQIDIPWGTTSVVVEVPVHRMAGVLGANVSQAADPEAVLLDALAGRESGSGKISGTESVGSRNHGPGSGWRGSGRYEEPETASAGGLTGLPLDAFLNEAEPPLVVVVNDGTRPTPTADVLRVARGSLESWSGRTGECPLFLVATGTHRPASEPELSRIFGPDLLAVWRDRIVSHDSLAEEDLEDLGVTSRGTPIFLNRRLVEARSVILINSVEPHYFAGFTGGRKSLFPGLAGYQSVCANHRLAMEPGAQALVLEGNPVHEDLEEAAAVAIAGRKVYSVQLVLDRQHHAGFAATGDLRSTFRRAVEVAERQFVLELERQHEVVLAVAPYPMDCDFYQTNKAIQFGALAVKDGGILIVVSECPFGLGHNRILFERLSAAASPADALVHMTKEQYSLGLQQPARMASILERIQVWVVTSLDDRVVRSMFMTPCPNVQEAIDVALAEQGSEAQMLVLREASITVPRVKARV